MRYLEADEVIAINSVVTSPYGESCLVTARAALDEAIATQKEQDNPTHAASALLAALLDSPAFAAGNARTAVVAALWLLEQEGLELSATDDELASRLRAMKSEGWSPSRIAEWLRGHLRPVTSLT